MINHIKVRLHFILDINIGRVLHIKKIFTLGNPIDIITKATMFN